MFKIDREIIYMFQEQALFKMLVQKVLMKKIFMLCTPDCTSSDLQLLRMFSQIS